jgi:hypothetical protein
MTDVLPFHPPAPSLREGGSCSTFFATSILPLTEGEGAGG